MSTRFLLLAGLLLVAGCASVSGDGGEPAIFEVAEVQPELIGGLTGLQERLEYPEAAIRAGIEGQVVVQFIVNERGSVVDPVVLRSPSELLNEAALKVVRESRFTPGQQRGRPVCVRFAVPVTFRLR
ncbi:energy transducer TonB [Rubrivirga sp.]|uniref:energy transducer TonB n=1 Tax=Rubrivirga sp. TaxID=1885344 RepID=UPI003B51C4D6